MLFHLTIPAHLLVSIGAQCAHNAKNYEKIHYIIEEYPMITNEGSFESKLCIASFEIGHNGNFSILKPLGVILIICPLWPKSLELAFL